jgi:glycosyltransferase involved in cell wall biosynthesis
MKLYSFLTEYKNKKLPYQITILGNGIYLNSLKNHVSYLGLNKIVKFKGWIKDIENYYSNCDLLIHPSGLEAFGMSLLEAGASAKPTIATNVGGIPEIIVDKETGYLTNDINSFLDYIEKLMENNDLRKEMGLNARHRIINKFTWEDIAKKFYEILKIEKII